MFKLFDTDIQYLHGVGPSRADLLRRYLDVRTFYDLLYLFPYRYIDRSSIHHISDLQGEELPWIQLKGRFVNFATQGEGAKRRLVGLFSDGTGLMEMVWFNRVKQIANSLQTGVEYVVFGRPSMFGGRYSIVHPELDKATQNFAPSGLQGMYSIPEPLRNRGFTSKTIRSLVETLLAHPIVKGIGETLPASIIEQHRLMPLGEALKAIHCPQSLHELQRAQLRLKYDELFFLQLNILKFAHTRNVNIQGFKFPRVGQYFNDFYYKVLPFPLTDAQKRVIKEMRADMLTGRQMNRLLQGDVGSGKTLVALMVMLIAIDNGYQACLMAPTEILASQHYETLKEWAGKVGVTVELLTGSTRKKQRDAIHEGLESGTLQLLIGTHAVIEDNVKFKNLGLVVIDEQHRFGVAQRAKLWRKNTTAPHVLVMTATPIPRTLAMTVYGDLDVSVIDQLPPGRKPIYTTLRTDQSRKEVYQFLSEQLKLGRQAYIVYPLIKENEKLDMKNLEEGLENVSAAFPDYNVCIVHGKMKPAIKEAQMQRFVSGEAHIMVATTVIEVGVNVPNASVMIIENAERFGLSQLHQLRGRVGRGADQSFCILMSKHNLTKETKHRLVVMTQTTDGFALAEEDLRLRGPGDMEGTQQSGVALNLRIANLASDGAIIQMARDDARVIITADPSLASPQNAVLLRLIDRLFNRKVDWSQIS